jgi:hypothetical protein
MKSFKLVAYPVQLDGDTLHVSFGAVPIYGNSVIGIKKQIGMGQLIWASEWDDSVMQPDNLTSYPDVYDTENGSKYIICTR